MGESSSGGADALLSRATLEGLVASDNGDNDDLRNQRLELQLSYGFLAFGERFTLTPELGLGLYDSTASAGAWHDRMLGNHSRSPST